MLWEPKGNVLTLYKQCFEKLSALQAFQNNKDNENNFYYIQTKCFLMSVLVFLFFFETRSVYHSATDGRRSIVGIHKSVFFVELAKGAV